MLGPNLSPLFSRVLVGVDGSEGAEEAVRQGARVASLVAAELEAVFVAEPGRPIPLVQPEAEPTEWVDAILQEASLLAEKEEVGARTRLLLGDPATCIVDEALERYVDLVCVGPDAGFADRPRILGRVAARVVRSTHCSVMVARPKPGEQGRFPERILVGVDGSEHATEAVRQAAGLAVRADAELRLIHALPVVSGPGLGWIEAPREIDPLAILEAGREVAREEGAAASLETLIGRPEPALAEAARGWDADLLVVGSRGRQGLSRLMLGSVSEWEARHAPCSVLVARPRGG